jgi:hypothetical protein
LVLSPKHDGFMPWLLTPIYHQKTFKITHLQVVSTLVKYPSKQWHILQQPYITIFTKLHSLPLKHITFVLMYINNRLYDVGSPLGCLWPST